MPFQAVTNKPPINVDWYTLDAIFAKLATCPTTNALRTIEFIILVYL